TSQIPPIHAPGLEALTCTPLSPEMAEEWSRLFRGIAEDGGNRWKPTATELREGLEPTSNFDPALQTWSVWSGEEMVAFAETEVRSTPAFDGRNTAHVLGGVHPSWRGRGLGSALLKVAESRCKELAHT